MPVWIVDQRSSRMATSKEANQSPDEVALRGTATCEDVQHHDGSWMFTFKYQSDHITVEKGSITINGTSLTVVDSEDNGFSVCIIPYTYENTSFKSIQKGSLVNLEFDILGKYIKKYLRNSNS